MPRYRVRQAFRHEGVELLPGTSVDLPRRLANELSHLVDEVDRTGKVLTGGTPAWTQALDGVREHEKASVLTDERVKAVAAVQRAQLLAEETAADAKQAAAQYLTAQAVVDDIDRAVEALSGPPAKPVAVPAPKSGAKE